MMNGQGMPNEAQDFASGDRVKKLKGKINGEQKRKQKLEVKDQLETATKRSQRIAAKSYVNKNIHTKVAGCTSDERLFTSSTSDSPEDYCSVDDLSSSQNHHGMSNSNLDEDRDVIIIHQQNPDGLQDAPELGIIKQNVSEIGEEEEEDNREAADIDSPLLQQQQQQQQPVTATAGPSCSEMGDSNDAAAEQDEMTNDDKSRDDASYQVDGSGVERSNNEQAAAAESSNLLSVRGDEYRSQQQQQQRQENAAKEYTQMKRCDGSPPQPQQSQPVRQTTDQQQQQQQQQQQNQIYGGYGQDNSFLYQQGGGIGQVWYPHDPTFGSNSSMPSQTLPSLHYPQPQTSAVSSFRQPQYGMDSPAAAGPGQGYGYQHNPMTPGYGGSSYLPQYALGADGQYYRAVQGSEGVRYEMIDSSTNSAAMMGSAAAAAGIAGIPPPHNYRTVMQNPALRVVSPPSTSSSSSYHPSTSRAGGTSGPSVSRASGGGGSGSSGQASSKKEWRDEDDSDDEEVGKMKEGVQKKERVKRPMNAFLVWSCQKRAILAKNNPGMNNADISVRLGERWKSMTPAQKQPFYQEAEKIKAAHKLKYPEWTYQPKPKKRRLGQGTTWLYAITENTRGGRVSHYINSYNHYDGNLVLSSLNSPTSSATGGASMPPSQMAMPGMQSLQAPTPPPHHAMYVNPSLNPALGQRSGASLMGKYDPLPPHAANPSVYLQNQPNILMGNQQSAQPYQQQQQQQQDSANSLYTGNPVMTSSSSGVYHHHPDLTGSGGGAQLRPQNLSMNQYSPPPNTIPVTSYMSDLTAASATSTDVSNLMNLSTDKDDTEKDGNDENGEKQNSLSPFDENSMSSLRQFLNSNIIAPPTLTSAQEAVEHQQQQHQQQQQEQEEGNGESQNDVVDMTQQDGAEDSSMMEL